MQKKYALPFVFVIFIVFGSANIFAQRLTTYVNPFIGTGGHGHTYPGATVPFGMVQLSPDNGTNGWDWSSGYNYADSTIAGFSHTHLSGTGDGEWCDISVMPNDGLLPDAPGIYKQKFDHANEKASPGFYSVTLNNGIKVNLTATERCGLHAYTFPANSTPVISFDLGFIINEDHTEKTYIKKLDDSTIVGYRYSTGWADIQRVYFAATSSVPFSSMHLSAEGKIVHANETSGTLVKGQLVFTSAAGKTILLKVALSSVNTYSALKALKEIQGWDFDAVKKQAEDKWEHELEKIEIKTSDEHLKHIFYTALYHTCMAPVIYSDADGTYKNANGDVLKMKKGTRYTLFSLWDTFRALHPLFTITQDERIADILNSMLAFHDENGLLPVWDLSTFETNGMTGYHSVPVLADAILKNIPGIDAAKAYRCMKQSAHQADRGTPNYIKYGYLPQNKEGFSVTITLEYAFDDWCIAQVAKKLGYMDDYRGYTKRSNAYKMLFDSTTGFMRAKNSDGKWVKPFDPFFSEHDEKAAYREGNAWQYTFFVPQDVRGLAKLFGQDDKFETKLDSLFTIDGKVTGANASADISGMIGQYAHGNEPSHHIAYLYNYIGKPWKTQQRVRQITDSMYHDDVDGYAGNEDCGQISAWAIWSMMGMYPVNPASGQYVLGSPVMNEVKINLPHGKAFIIKTKNNNAKNIYIQSILFNGEPYNKAFLSHTDMLKGGLLEIEMGPQPNKQWGVVSDGWPG